MYGLYGIVGTSGGNSVPRPSLRSIGLASGSHTRLPESRKDSLYGVRDVLRAGHVNVLILALLMLWMISLLNLHRT